MMAFAAVRIAVLFASSKVRTIINASDVGSVFREEVPRRRNAEIRQ
jgi:hypothetical protein